MTRLARRDALSLLRRTGVMAIMDDGLLSESGMVRLCRVLRNSGVKVFQLRCKRTGDRRFLALARKARAVLSGEVLFINDRCDIAALSKADGVHLGNDDLSPRDARRIAGRRILIGVSAGNSTELAAAIKGRPDYISIGPAFGTGTKKDAGRALGPEGFRRLAKGVPSNCLRLAVGGVTAHNVGVLLGSGADAAAAASWWSGKGRPEGRAKMFLAAVRRAKPGIRRKGKLPGRETRRWRV